MDITMVGQALVNWLVVGSLYVLIAVGLTLVFSIMGIINFAHAQWYVLGAFALYYLYIGMGIPYLAAVVLSALAVGLLALVVERIFIRPLQDNPLRAMIGTLGLLLILSGLTLELFGAKEKYVPPPVTEILRIGTVFLPVQKLIAVIVAFVLVAGLGAYLRWMRTGRAMRAISQDPDGARLQGINVTQINVIGFVIGSALAAFAGALLLPITSAVSPSVGDPIMAKMFIIVILGGLGSVWGAVAGAFLLAFIETFLFTFIGGLAILLSFLLVLLVLLVRPQGLFGRA
jgi:branched-chain amino acid transport system permease protein